VYCEKEDAPHGPLAATNESKTDGGKRWKRSGNRVKKCWLSRIFLWFSKSPAENHIQTVSPMAIHGAEWAKVQVGYCVSFYPVKEFVLLYLTFHFVNNKGDTGTKCDWFRELLSQLCLRHCLLHKRNQWIMQKNKFHLKNYEKIWDLVVFLSVILK
jgi:hypothetical protein